MGSYKGDEVLRGAIGQRMPEFRIRKVRVQGPHSKRRLWQGPKSSPVLPTPAPDKQE